VRDLDDDAMIRAMADENISQFGRDEYATYREAVTAAVERLLPDPETVQNILDRLDPDGHNTKQMLAAIEAGGCPGERVIAAFFHNTLALGPVRIALKAYRETGKLAAWHGANNPRGADKSPAPTLSA
jgi:hypothetical protein